MNLANKKQPNRKILWPRMLAKLIQSVNQMSELCIIQRGSTLASQKNQRYCKSTIEENESAMFLLSAYCFLPKIKVISFYDDKENHGEWFCHLKIDFI